jgi:hypothetical protein
MKSLHARFIIHCMCSKVRQMFTNMQQHKVVKCTQIRKTEGPQSHWYVQKLKTEPEPHVNTLFS